MTSDDLLCTETITFESFEKAEEEMERRAFARHSESLAQLMDPDDVADFCAIFDRVNPSAFVTPYSEQILTAAKAIARASYDGKNEIVAAVKTALDESKGRSWIQMAIYYYVCRATTNPAWRGTRREASVYKSKMNAAFDGMHGWAA